MFIHDIIKIKYVSEGYLPNYPYHMIDDEEMCSAFMLNHSGFFYDNYGCLKDTLLDAHDLLVSAIQYHINQFLNTRNSTNIYSIPDWVYGYMLGTVIGKNSDSLDIHDLISTLDVDNPIDEFGSPASIACYNVSQDWLRKQPTFNANSRYITVHGNRIDLRPPTMFGEPHVIKSLRVNGANPI